MNVEKVVTENYRLCLSREEMVSLNCVYEILSNYFEGNISHVDWDKFSKSGILNEYDFIIRFYDDLNKTNFII